MKIFRFKTFGMAYQFHLLVFMGRNMQVAAKELKEKPNS